MSQILYHGTSLSLEKIENQLLIPKKQLDWNRKKQNSWVFATPDLKFAKAFAIRKAINKNGYTFLDSLSKGSMAVILEHPVNLEAFGYVYCVDPTDFNHPEHTPEWMSEKPVKILSTICEVSMSSMQQEGYVFLGLQIKGDSYMELSKKVPPKTSRVQWLKEQGFFERTFYPLGLEK